MVAATKLATAAAVAGFACVLTHRRRAAAFAAGIELIKKRLADRAKLAVAAVAAVRARAGELRARERATDSKILTSEERSY